MAVPELVSAARAGDQDATAALIAEFLPLVRAVVGRALRGHADVDDVVQECLVKVLRGLPGLREPDRFAGWVAAIAQREVQEYRRQGGRRPATADPEAVAEIPDDSGDLAERTVARIVLSGQRRDLADAVDWLPGPDRRLLALWWREAAGELSRADLARTLGLGEKHLSVRVRRLRTRLDAARTVTAALRHRTTCPDLARVVDGWDGKPSPLWRKRLHRHVQDCERCAAHASGLVPPERLLHGLSMPAILLAAGTAAISRGVSTAFWHKVAAAAAVASLTTGGILWAVHETPLENPAPAVAAPPLDLPARAVPPSARPSATASASAGPTAPPFAPDIVVAPDGADTGDGTPARPYATLNRAVEVVRPGQTIALRGGTYRLTQPVEIGTAGTRDSRIVLTGYPGERPVLDAAGVPAGKWAVTQRAGFWTIQDLEVRGSRSHAWVCVSCAYTVFQRLSMHDNARSALTLRDPGTIGNQVLDSDFWRNYDDSDNGGSGIGVGVKFGSGDGNVLRGNRAFDNADDGFDLGAFDSPVTVEGNWAYGNGRNRWGVADWDSNGYGFSLGGGPATTGSAHVVRDNAAWDNQGHGFGVDGNLGGLLLDGNVAYDNDGAGFDLAGATGRARNNVASGNAADVRGGDEATVTGNSWNAGGPEPRAYDFAGAEGPRRADGALPRI